MLTCDPCIKIWIPCHSLANKDLNFTGPVFVCYRVPFYGYCLLHQGGHVKQYLFWAPFLFFVSFWWSVNSSLYILSICLVDPCDTPCTQEYNPVCASNGETYPNLCEFKKMQCKDPDLRVVVNGTCDSGEKWIGIAIENYNCCL